MGRWLTLLVLIILTIGSLVGYLFLTEKIISGNARIAAGKKQLEQGEQMLARGKARLANGEQQLSQAKNTYHVMKHALLAAVVMPVTGGILMVASDKIAKDKISEGSQLVAAGQKKIKAGEGQLAEGKLELSHGEQQLTLANKMRIACAVAAGFFAFLTLIFAVWWRKTVKKILK